MAGEGFKFTMSMVVGFVLISMGALWMVATGKADVATLKELFISLGILAALFGIPQAVQAWIQTRGQTVVAK